jgi:hypothetical protein
MTKEQVKEKEKQLLEITGAFCRQNKRRNYRISCKRYLKNFQIRVM